MATTDIEALRALTDGAVGYTDEQLAALLVSAGKQANAARTIWRAKAASYSTMVNISESGSSRNLGDLYKNALAMADSFGKDDIAVVTSKVKRTRQAARR